MTDGWQTVADLPRLQDGELQVWRIDMAVAEESLDIYKQHLPGEELERADRMRAKQVRLQFVVGRACLRVLLGALLDLPPKEVAITLSAYDKPELANAGVPPIFFNLAHSRETILIAICRESAVGVDLEYFDRETEILDVARASFADAECRQIEAVGDPAGQREAFFRCWTRKEAVVKADGRGLSLSLTSFEVPVGADAKAARIRVREEISNAAATPGGKFAESFTDWYVSDLPLGDEIAGAFVVAVPDLQPTTLIFPSYAISKASSNG